MGKRIKLSEKALRTLGEFEKDLNPQDPEKGKFSPKIIGYGEMSTVFRFEVRELSKYAFKRMAIFRSQEEIDRYKEIYFQYHNELQKRKIETPDFGFETVKDRSGKQVVYILQSLHDPKDIVNKKLHIETKEKNLILYEKILSAIDLSFRWNEKENSNIEIGLDGQISNWAFQKKLLYIDTSTPLIRENGIEKLNTELFLRICPSYLVWIIRLFFLKGVLNRYYDIRLVIIDTIANLYKEKRGDWVVDYLAKANSFLMQKRPDVKKIEQKEIESYYSEDKTIWRLFLFFRKVERKVNISILKKSYDIILPEKIER